MCRVSVVLPVYNGERFLTEALDSLAAQTFQDFEVVVVDDGSTDGSSSIVSQYENLKIALHAMPHGGIATAINFGVARAKGEFIARQDADDISSPDRLLTQVAYLDRHPSVGLVGSNAWILGSDGNRTHRTVFTHMYDEDFLDSTAIRRRLPIANCVVAGSVLIRRPQLEHLGGYRPAFAFASDYDLWLRLAEVCDLANLPDALYGWRIHAKSMWGANFNAGSVYAEIARALAVERRLLGSDSLQREGGVRFGSRFDAVLRAVDRRDFLLARALVDELVRQLAKT